MKKRKKTMTQNTVKLSKNVLCENCYKKLCKICQLKQGKFIVFRHKKSELITNDAVIRCIQCGKQYYITAEDGLSKEVEIGTA